MSFLNKYAGCLVQAALIFHLSSNAKMSPLTQIFMHAWQLIICLNNGQTITCHQVQALKGKHALVGRDSNQFPGCHTDLVDDSLRVGPHRLPLQSLSGLLGTVHSKSKLLG